MVISIDKATALRTYDKVQRYWRERLAANDSRLAADDKPMRDQTLMQTITRANRVFPGKNNGLIVGYVDVLGNLHGALAIYASSGALGAGQLPVEEKEGLVEALRSAIAELQAFCLARDVDLVATTKQRSLTWRALSASRAE